MNQTPQQIALTSPALQLQHDKGKNVYPPAWRGKVPLKVKMAIDVKPDLPHPALKNHPSFQKDKKIVAKKDNEYYVWVNSFGAVCAIFDDGKQLGLKPYEFEVVQWHKK